MIARLVVASEEVVGASKLEPCPGQPGTKRKNCLEALRCPLRHAKAHLDSAEQEEPLDAFFLTGRPCRLEECSRVLQPAGSDQEPAGLQVGKFSRR